MGKLVSIIGLMSGIVLLFYFGGVLTDTATSTLLDLVLNPDRFETASLVLKIVGVIGIIVGVVSLIRRSGSGVNDDKYLMIPLVELFISFGWDFLRVYQQLASFNSVAGVVGILIFGPFMVMYIVAVVEWWRGVEA